MTTKPPRGGSEATGRRGLPPPGGRNRQEAPVPREVPKGTTSGTPAEDRSGDHWRRPGRYRRGKVNEREVDVRRYRAQAHQNHPRQGAPVFAAGRKDTTLKTAPSWTARMRRPWPGMGYPLRTEQREDPTLRHAWDTAREEAEGQAGTADRPAGPHFEVRADRLYRVDEGGVDQGTRRQLLVPRRYRYPLMEVAHANPWAGHLGQEKTVKRILQRFYWPGVYREVRDFCESCPQCQKAGPRNVPKAPLVPLPVVDVPFERIAMDVVGPLDKSKAGHQYILVILDYATRYPEAVPLRNTYATTIATELMKLFSRVGLPREILTDQGTNFTSRVMSELCRLFQIKSIRTSVYHPQTDGLVERFNRTLKGMLRRFTEQDPRDWDTLLPALLFAVREAPQASTGFSPFELLYGRQPRGILDVIRERWEDQETRVRGSVQYILDLRQRLRSLAEVARDNLESAQEVQARYYNRGARLRVFEPGQRVLLLLPTPGSKLVAKWQGPFEVVRRIGEVDYEVKLTGRAEGTKVYHVNLLKAWKGREAMFINPLPPDPELGPGGVEQTTPGLLQLGDDLDPEQRMEMEALLHQFPDVMTEQPGHTAVTYHHIETEPGKKVRDQVRPLPRKMWEPVKEELQRMIQWGVVEESYSEWRSPIVLVPKPDGSMRFCIDFRKVNALSRFDAYPMPRVDELLDRLGGAQYLSTLDLTRGYWQIPLSPPSREKTAFSTPFGLYHFVRMPFGLHGAAATFQRLMDRVLKTHDQFAAAYIDDIVVYSKSWAEHLQHVKAILQELRQAGLTANPRKCHFGEKEVSYLGYTVGRGRLRPLVEKVAALRTFQPPRTKRQVRRFLGLAGYYRRFVPNFAAIAAPLTDLTRAALPQKVRWSPECEKAFQELKDRLIQAPVLAQPDFSRPFTLYTDASETGIGAVLAQGEGADEHPVIYISRKLFMRERKYATVEKEALAVKWAIDLLRYYLLGNRFRVVTDHAPLRWLQTMKDTNARVMRWYLSLQPYAFDVAHRAGSLHQNADFFSRRHEEEEEETTELERVTDLGRGVCDEAAPARPWGAAEQALIGEKGGACRGCAACTRAAPAQGQLIAPPQSGNPGAAGAETTGGGRHPPAVTDRRAGQWGHRTGGTGNARPVT
ncbi:uncharacterized protein LOC142826318 [Pelodiscus sinensis]|uniref:uncharacterized protein LOC142826318 n=1 Tax=Pelodiscus sinensis TaxID=13735 RepID=UPI003F6D40B4